MATLEGLAAALREAGYAPVGFEGLPPRASGNLGYVGAKDHWGSVGTVALVRADGLPLEEVEARLEALHQLAEGLHPLAASLVYRPVAGAPVEVPLGSYATLVAVFEGGATYSLVERLRALRRGGRGRVLTTCWVVDAPLRKVWDNRGLPYGLPPGRALLRNALG